MLEVDEVRLPGDPPRALIDAAQREEAGKILKKLPSNAYVTALCVEGEQISSQEFAQALERRMQVNGSFAFIIGGSYGLAQTIKDSAGLKLSLSAMTFPHMTARVVLLEQLYRALSIIEGGKYHK
jgi:23S rRNA (pseudouridine1915-N3)-methyltransferase